MKSSLGIYFSPEVISVVESKGKKFLKSFQVPLSILINKTSDEEKVPEEIKLVTLLKEEFKKNKIDSKEVILTLSGIDLIIRTFEIPVLSANERSTAMSLEVRKYIPFKIEELVSDFQFSLDGVNRRYYVLFAGIMKETLEKYLTIVKELDIKVKAIEYSAFSLLKLINLTGADDKGVTGVITIDTQEEGAADFTVTENGFPLFSRDIRLAVENVKDAEENKPQIENKLSDKLKTELRISLEYYKRKFPAKQINNIYFIGDPFLEESIKGFSQELNLSSLQVINTSKFIDKDSVFSLNFLKAYCAAVGPVVKTNVNLNILSAWEKSKKSEEISQQLILEYRDWIISLLQGISPKTIIFALLICGAVFGFSIAKKLPLRKMIDEITASRPKLSIISSTASKQELAQLQDNYSGDIKTLEEKIKKQFYLTPELSDIAKLVPKGMWLTALNFKTREKEKNFKIEGFVYLEDNMQEVAAVNNFINNLIKDDIFSKNFSNISITNVDTQEIEKKKVTHFVIIGESKPKSN
ncbi:MAG: pilus assembly protein PilM [Candidatus Omnitrophota bacterium]